MHWTSAQQASQIPGRRPLLLVESDQLSGARPVPGFDVIVCSGPESGADTCPLVLDGACPVGKPDVVVCSLGDDWRRPVAAAWRQEGVPVVTGAADWPACVGGAFQRLFGAYEGNDDDAD